MNLRVLKTFTIVIFTFFLFFGNTNSVFAGCGGALQCYGLDDYGSCDYSNFVGTNSCSGDSENVCLNSADCASHCSSGANCTWTDPLPTSVPCVPNWGGCPTDCGYDEGYNNVDANGCFTNGWCDATGACCTNSNPDTPVLSAPASGTTVNVNTSVNLNWNDFSSWGTNCSGNTNKYEVCVMSDTTCNLLNWVDVASGTTIKSWTTPSSGDASVSWKVRSNNGYGTTTSATRTLCIENQLCDDPQCGETKLCGGVCPTTHKGAPTTPSCTSLGTVTAMPVTISWTGGGTLTDYYNYRIDGGTAVNNGISLSKSVTLSGGSHTWAAQSVNTSCGTEANSWSLACSLCYENTNCSPACKQPKICGGNCLDTDNGNPGAPVLTAPTPIGDQGNAKVYLVGQNVTLDWNSVATAEYYRVYVKNSTGGAVTSDTGVSATTTTFGSFIPGIYRWYVDAVNSTCQPFDTVVDIGPTSVNSYFRVNSPPVINSITITNNVGTTLAVETGNKNHICQSTFSNRPEADRRKVRFLVNASDPDGGNQISSINLTWHGKTYSTTLQPVTDTYNKAGVVDVPFASGDNDGGVWGVGATVVDIYGSSGQLTPRSFKVWNCQVPVSGSLYDKTGITVGCPDWTGLPKSGPDIGFNDLKFVTVASPGIVVPMDLVTPYPNYASPVGVGLTWGKNYISVFNNGSYPSKPLGNLLASDIGTRIIDLGAGTAGSCPAQEFNIGTWVSPYFASPRAQIDFTFIEDQEAWYQVVGAGVKSAGPLSYGVPVTALVASRFLTLGNSTVYNGLVSATSFTNNNGNNNKDDLGGPGLPEPYKNWYVLRNTNDLDIYNYNYFYNNFFVKAGVGETKTSWGGWSANKIYFVDRTLNIISNSPAVNLNTQTMMVIVKGDITIQQGVTQLDGIYIADGSIIAGGDYTNALIINGMLYAGGSIKLNRSFSDKTKNNTEPAVKVNYSPGLIFNLDPRVLRVLSGWREE